MATYRYSGQAVVANDDILENATGGTFVDAAGTTIPIYDLNDNPISTITSNAFGQSSNFKADVPMGYIKFGSVLNRVFADEIAEFAVNAQFAIGDAEAAVAAAENAVTLANQALLLAQQALAEAQSGGGGGGLPTDTDLDDIPDGITFKRMTVTERNKLATIATGATALTIGTSATQAKAGNWPATAAELATLRSSLNAVQNLGGFTRVMGWTGPGQPTAADGIVDGDWVAIPTT